MSFNSPICCIAQYRLRCTISRDFFVHCSIVSLDVDASPEARAAMDPSPIRQRRGLLIVLSSPSGAGKSTIARMLLDADHGIGMSVSATTRPPRPGEVEGVDY